MQYAKEPPRIASKASLKNRTDDLRYRTDSYSRHYQQRDVNQSLSGAPREDREKIRIYEGA